MSDHRVMQLDNPHLEQVLCRYCVARAGYALLVGQRKPNRELGRARGTGPVPK